MGNIKHTSDKEIKVPEVWLVHQIYSLKHAVYECKESAVDVDDNLMDMHGFQIKYADQGEQCFEHNRGTRDTNELDNNQCKTIKLGTKFT